MRIGIVTSQFPSLSETFVLNHMVGLIEADHEVDILARFIQKDEGIHPHIQNYNLMDHLYSWGEGEGGKTFLCGLRAAWTVLKKDFQVFWQCLKFYKVFQEEFQINIFYPVSCFLKRPAYDIILCHYGFNGNLVIQLKQMGVLHGKVVTIFHGTDIRWGLQKGGQVYHNLFEDSDKIISISQYNFENLIHFGASTEKVVHIPVGIDVDKFRIVRPWREHKGPHYFLTIARLVKEKSLHIAIEAMAHFKKRNPRMKFKYLIIGDGDLREDLQQQIKELDLEKNVVLLGGLDQNRIIEHLSQADIFLLPSANEALPLSLMEAQAGGLPVIASNVGSIRDILVHEESGFLVEPGDPIALVEKIEYCMDHPEKAYEMGKFGQKIMEQRFDTHILNYKLNEMLQELHDQDPPEARLPFGVRFYRKIMRGVQKIQYKYEVFRDTNRLRSQYREINSMEKLLAENQERLRPYYDEFIDSVAIDWMAISLELGAFLLTWCQVMKPKKIADLGTGFGSFVFRLYASEEEGVTVYSVDDDPSWLAKTQDFLTRYDLSIEHTMVWEGFHLQDPRGFDLILHDLGPMETRDETLPFALSQLKPGGFCLIDDMHKEDFTVKARKIIKDANADMYTLSKYTKDKYRRYSTLAVRPEEDYEHSTR